MRIIIFISNFYFCDFRVNCLKPKPKGYPAIQGDTQSQSSTSMSRRRTPHNTITLAFTRWPITRLLLIYNYTRAGFFLHWFIIVIMTPTFIAFFLLNYTVFMCLNACRIIFLPGIPWDFTDEKFDCKNTTKYPIGYISGRVQHRKYAHT